jgi:hypothetical protein
MEPIAAGVRSVTIALAAAVLHSVVNVGVEFNTSNRYSRTRDAVTFNVPVPAITPRPAANVIRNATVFLKRNRKVVPGITFTL